MLSLTLSKLVPFALAAVAIVLVLGLWNMTKNDSASRSQKLMRWRVGLQFVAVIIIMLSLYLAGQKM